MQNKFKLYNYIHTHTHIYIYNRAPITHYSVYIYLKLTLFIDIDIYYYAYLLKIYINYCQLLNKKYFSTYTLLQYVICLQGCADNKDNKDNKDTIYILDYNIQYVLNKILDGFRL